MSASEVMKMIKDKGVKYVDFRFTDTKGKEQHVSVPAHTMDEDVLEYGKMFDG
ncbi:MAG: glutamine synthetase beta-grasp domain-containing protein, partial [Gammaproteobacteria bacterium]